MTNSGAVSMNNSFPRSNLGAACASPALSETPSAFQILDVMIPEIGVLDVPWAPDICCSSCSFLENLLFG